MKTQFWKENCKKKMFCVNCIYISVLSLISMQLKNLEQIKYIIAHLFWAISLKNKHIKNYKIGKESNGGGEG